MKLNKLLYPLLLLVAMVACKNENDDLTFGERPEIRMKEKIDSISFVLQTATNGWKAVLGTGLGGGYSFYLNFNGQQEVNMMADLTATSATTAAKSNYRIKQDNGATLIFDTFNYISLLNDPSSSTFNGVTRDGYKSDLEFAFAYSKGDTLGFIGKRFRQSFVLIKATAAEKSAYEAGNLKKSLDNTVDYFKTNANPYIDVADGNSTYKMAVTVNTLSNNTNGKRIEFASLLADGTTSAVKGKYAFALDGVTIIDGGLTYRGVTYVSILAENGKMYLVDSKGAKSEIKNSVQPILPLFKLMGSKYVGMRSPYKTYYPGTSASGLTILQRFHNGLASGTGYVFNSGYMELGWDVANSRIELRGFSSQNGGSSGWLTTIVYNYTLDEATGTYKCTLKTAASGGYTSAILDQMHSFLLKNSFKLDYYLDGGILYGSVASVENPDIVMTFQLR